MTDASVRLLVDCNIQENLNWIQKEKQKGINQANISLLINLHIISTDDSFFMWSIKIGQKKKKKMPITVSQTQADVFKCDQSKSREFPCTIQESKMSKSFHLKRKT